MRFQAAGRLGFGRDWPVGISDDRASRPQADEPLAGLGQLKRFSLAWKPVA